MNLTRLKQAVQGVGGGDPDIPPDPQDDQQNPRPITFHPAPGPAPVHRVQSSALPFSPAPAAPFAAGGPCMSNIPVNTVGGYAFRGLSWFANIPTTLIAGFDEWIDEMLDSLDDLTDIRATIATVCAAIFFTAAGYVFIKIDGASQTAAYVAMGAGPVGAILVVALLNAAESYGMLVSNRIGGAIIWGITTLINIWINVQFLPDTIHLANSSDVWNVLISFAVSSGPQFIMLVAMRSLLVTWLNGIYALAGVFGMIAKTPRAIRSGFTDANPANIRSKRW